MQKIDAKGRRGGEGDVDGVGNGAGDVADGLGVVVSGVMGAEGGEVCCERGTTSV